MSEQKPGEQPPNDQEIRRMLMQLHEELEQAQTLDENERAMMRHLMNDIQATLERTGHHPTSSFVDRLEESVEVLEVSHPTLSSIIRKALDTLNIAGI
jgi:polyhydroxyalkanoate synthesis regulator phasin